MQHWSLTHLHRTSLAETAGGWKGMVEVDKEMGKRDKREGERDGVWCVWVWAGLLVGGRELKKLKRKRKEGGRRRPIYTPQTRFVIQ